MKIEVVHQMDLDSAEGKYLLKQIADTLADEDSTIQADFLNILFGGISTYPALQSLAIKELLSVESQSVVSILSGNH